MIFKETTLQGAFILELEVFEDDRGFFAQGPSQRDFLLRKLEPCLIESGISFNQKKGTLRGMHYQAAPHSQAKIVRCTMGSIYDVVIDLRIGSPTFKQWVATELTANNRLMLYIPKDFAHGFQTLEDDTEVFYQMSDRYVPESGRGVRWNDPAFGISWPETINVTLNEIDQTYPNFLPASDGVVRSPL